MLATVSATKEAIKLPSRLSQVIFVVLLFKISLPHPIPLCGLTDFFVITGRVKVSSEDDHMAYGKRF